MELLNALIELIEQLGFPAAMVIYFIWDKTKITNQLTTAINNNNLILQKLLTKLGQEELSVE